VEEGNKASVISPCFETTIITNSNNITDASDALPGKDFVHHHPREKQASYRSMQKVLSLRSSSAEKRTL